MPRTRPNPQLKQIVLEETNDGRDVVRFLKSTFMNIEDAPQLFGLRHKDYARTHKIAAARILARLGLEDGKRYLRRNYVQTPFKRVHPEDEDLPKKDMAASTAKLYRLVKKETNDGRDIIIRFVGIMKGYYPEYKPHLRMAAAKELIRQIEFDYDEPSPSGSDTAAAEPSEVASASPANPGYPEYPVNPASDKEPDTDHPHPEYPDNPVNPASDKEPNPVHPATLTSDSISTNQSHPENPAHPANPDSDDNTATGNPIDNSQLTIENSDEKPRPHHEYAREHCAPEEESIFRSIIRRAAGQPDLDSAKVEAEKLIEEFNRFAEERNPAHRIVAVPDDLLSRSLTQRMEAPETYIFDPAEYYDLDRDDFYFCLCRGCDECDELEFYIEFVEELEEETAHLLEDP